MKLTKSQRFIAYCILLSECENPSTYLHPDISPTPSSSRNRGLCWMWRMIFDTKELYYDEGELLPELNRRIHSPNWPEIGDWEARKEILIECINETA